MPNQAAMGRSVSPSTRELAARGAALGVPEPGAAPTAAPSPNDLLAMLKSGNLPPEMLMLLLAMLAGMGPGGIPGAGAAVPPELAGAGGSEIEQAFSGGGGVAY